MVQVSLIGVFVFAASAQPASSGRRAPADTRRTINNDTWRELMKVDRETPNATPNSPDPARLAMMKQLREDFKTIQEVNNRMMGEVWGQEDPNYAHVATMISEINTRANRLKDNLLLPESDTQKEKRKDVMISSARHLRSVLLVMDRSIMSFVRNPIFQNPGIVDVDQAKRASDDLENVIAMSASLRKLSAPKNK